MRNFNFLFVVCCTLMCVSLSAQNLANVSKKSNFAYAFKLTDEETKIIETKGMSAVTDDFLHTMVDSVDSNPRYFNDLKLAFGNYLVAYTEANQLHTQYFSVKPFEIKILNNEADLKIYLTDKSDAIIADAKVFLGSKIIPFNQKLQVYQLEKRQKGGLLRIEYKGIYYTKIKTQYPAKATLIKKRILFGFPLGYISRPIRDIKNSIKYKRPQGFVYNTKRFFEDIPSYFVNKKRQKEYKKERKFENENRFSFIVFNKPKYLPKDTVRFKAVLLDSKGKFQEQGELSVMLNSYNGGINNKKIIDLKPYSAGCYEGFFVLNDSLKLKLGFDYQLSLKNDDYDFVTNSFRYEQYDLKSETYLFTSPKTSYFHNEQIKLFAAGKDENDLPLVSTKLRIQVIPDWMSETKNRQVFVPNILWKHEQNLVDAPETVIVLPDSIFPEASLSFKVIAEFVSLDNSIQKRELRISRDIMKDFDASSKPEETRSDNPFQPNEPKTLSVRSSRTAEVIEIKINNPLKAKCWYSFFENNKKIKDGFTQDSLVLNHDASPQKDYSLSIQYIENDYLQTQNYSIPYQNKTIQIATTLPPVVSPSQEIEVEVSAKDAAGKPLPDVDLTAFSISKKFANLQNIPLNNFSVKPKARQIINHFDENKIYNINKTIELNWRKFHAIFGLDSNTYYRFLYPSTGLFQANIDAKNRCEFAPFVVIDGNLQAIEIIKVDKVPVYFSLAGTPRYSFGIKAGKHRLSLRTKDWLIETEEIEFKEGQKLVFSINPRIANSQYKVSQMLASANTEELWMLNNQILWLEDSQEDKIIKQKDKSFPIFKNNKFFNAVGPFFAGSAFYESFDSFKIDFAYEPNYSYSFSPSLVKMKERKPMTYFNFQNTKTEPILDELTMTEDEIRAAMKANLRSAAQAKIQFYNPSSTTVGKGSFDFLRLQSNTNNRYYCKVLFKNDDPNFIRIYQGNTNTFHDLEEGDYSLYVLFTNGEYGIASDLKLKKNGRNMLNINNLNVFPPDEKSHSIEAVLLEKYNFLLNQDAQKIKELFYETSNTNIGNRNANDVFITGLVKDSNKEPLPGVSVAIKGTNRGVATDINGRFNIYCPSNSVLVCGFVGFETKEVLVKNSTIINVVLKEDEQHLEEVVVVGYGVQYKRQLTGSVSMVSADYELQGRVAGVQIMSEGSPGSNKELLIRGVSSISATNPFIIIDGVPFSGNINDISPELLENIEILKGDAATALYGSKAAGGVLIISNKKKKPKNIEEVFEEAGASIRNNFRDDAFWQPKLKTDKNGKVKFKIKLPDDITNWETTVLGIGKNSETGQTKVNSKSFKSIVAKLSVPKFLIEGDTVEVSGIVRNYLSDSVLINTKFMLADKNLSQQSHFLASFVKDSIKIAAMRPDTLIVKYLMATTTGKADGEQRKIPVLARGIEENQGIFVFSARDTTFSYQVENPNSAVKIRIEASPIDILWNETLVLRDYKYLCNEQLASKLIAFLANKKLAKILKKPFIYDADIVKIIEKLTKNQNNKNRWGWWNVSESVDWISSHVSESLRMAKEMGYLVSIPKVDFEINKFIFEFDVLSTNAQIEGIKQVMQIDTAFKVKSFFTRIKNTEKLPLSERLDYELLGQKLGFQNDLSWLNKYENQTVLGGLFYGEKSYSPYQNEVLTTLKVVDLFKKRQIFSDKQQQILRFLFELRKNNGWRNTYESARILEVLVDYFGEIKPEEKSFVTVKIGEKVETIRKFPAEFFVNATDSIQFKTQANPFFISVSQKVFVSNPEPVVKDFDVKTKLIAKSGQIQSGEIITLSVDISLSKLADYTMLEIPIPASCDYLLAGDSSDIRMKGTRADFAEKFKEKTNIYFKNLTAGSYHFEIDLVARFSGTFSLNPAKVELMYFPIFFGREGIKKVVVD